MHLKAFMLFIHHTVIRLACAGWIGADIADDVAPTEPLRHVAESDCLLLVQSGLAEATL